MNRLTRLASPASGVPKFISARDLSLWYLALALLGVLPLVLLTPPLQVPDEQQHFFRAYQLSEGRLLSSMQNGLPGAELPASLAELSDRFIGRHSFNPTAENYATHHEPLRETLLAATASLDPERREFVEMVGAASYSPLGYAPQVIGIWVGRLFGAGPLVLLYAARIANGAAAILLVTAALRILPLGAMLALVAALLPMTIYLFASASPDAAVISTAFLFTAVVIRARFRGGWRPRDLLIACITGAVFCSVKPPYAPLLAMAVPEVLLSRVNLRSLAPQALVVAVAVSLTASWLFVSRDTAALREGPIIYNGQFQGFSPAAQLAGVFANPGAYALTVIRTVRLNASSWSKELVGKLGWLTITLSPLMHWMARGAVAASLLLPRAAAPRIGLLEGGWYALLVASSALLILTALYLTFTPVGGDFIQGVQGRYFLPLAALAAVALDGTIPQLALLRWPTALQVALPLVAINIVFTLHEVTRFFDVL